MMLDNHASTVVTARFRLLVSCILDGGMPTTTCIEALLCWVVSTVLVHTAQCGTIPGSRSYLRAEVH